MTPYVGDIRLFAGSFAPNGWAICDGSLLKIDDNQSLYYLYGTTFGGDGATTFGLPDLRARVPIGTGQGPGLKNYHQGEMGGEQAVKLTAAQMPKHSHPITVSLDAATTASPGPGVVPAVTDPSIAPYSHRSTANGTLASYAPQAVGVTGGTDAHSNLMPSLGINFIVALTGNFPSQ